jgi:hypothetical protein
MKIVVSHAKPRDLKPGDEVRLEDAHFISADEVEIRHSDHIVSSVEHRSNARYIVTTKSGRSIWCAHSREFPIVKDAPEEMVTGLTPDQAARKMHARTEFLVVALAMVETIDRNTYLETIRGLLMKAYDAGFADGEVFQRSVSRDAWLNIPPIEPGIDERRRNKLYGNS